MKDFRPLTFAATIVLGLSLSLPVPAWAQAPPSVGAAIIRQPNPPQVQINVDSLTTPLSDFAKESYQIAPGKNHDALLLAALLKDGAREDQSPRITTTVDTHASVNVVTPIPMQPPLTSSCDATPHINKDGSITVTMSLKKDTPLPSSSPGPVPVETSSVSVTNTFVDGQTQLVQYVSRSGNPNSVSLIFAKAKAVDPAAVQPTIHP